MYILSEDLETVSKINELINSAREPFEKIADEFFEEVTGEITCPFCGKNHTRRHPMLNVICKCGAKFYGIGEFWLNRVTGEGRNLNA